MLEASQPLFQDLTFTIIPNTMTQNRVHEVGLTRLLLELNADNLYSSPQV